MDFEIIETLDAGDDVLIVRGHRLIGGKPETTPRERAGKRGRIETEDVPVVTEARGWVSALSNYFEPAAYGEDGHLRKGAKPREMTVAEKRDYCSGLLESVVRSEPEALDIG